MNTHEYISDFLVLGSGIAGLTFAIKAAEYGTVTIVTKKKNYVSNTNYAQGGIASVISDNDNPANHIADTLNAGVTHCNRKAVELLVRNGPDRIRELIEWGANFSYRKNGDGSEVLDLGREGGHSINRIVHAKDYTGKEVERALLEKISQTPSITIYEDHTAVDLLTEHQLKVSTAGNRITCYGAYVLENESGIIR
ncbi:MAG: FAD-binding protein, partial [Spirochaetota bacterium]